MTANDTEGFDRSELVGRAFHSTKDFPDVVTDFVPMAGANAMTTEEHEAVCEAVNAFIEKYATEGHWPLSTFRALLDGFTKLQNAGQKAAE